LPGGAEGGLRRLLPPGVRGRGRAGLPPLRLLGLGRRTGLSPRLALVRLSPLGLLVRVRLAPLLPIVPLRSVPLAHESPRRGGGRGCAPEQAIRPGAQFR